MVFFIKNCTLALLEIMWGVHEENNWQIMTFIIIVFLHKKLQGLQHHTKSKLHEYLSNERHKKESLDWPARPGNYSNINWKSEWFVFSTQTENNETTKPLKIRSKCCPLVFWWTLETTQLFQVYFPYIVSKHLPGTHCGIWIRFTTLAQVMEWLY